MQKRYTSLLFFFIFLVAFGQDANTYLQPLKYRNIGPFRGGRSVATSGVVNNILTYYMGTTGGGLWKTEDAGTSWHNISDGYFKTGSVGAVAVSESNPNVLYCGMGEHAIRGVMTSYGDGVYKSTDAGKSWKKLGLEKTQQISRIQIHPNNPDIVYVAAQGAYAAGTMERGVYKSMDGGKTWKNVLFVNDLTGAVELSMDMNNPDVLYAAMWHHQRTPWKIISGGEGSGLYKSEDGGETWKQMKDGLPKEMGKMGIAVCRSNSNKVYAVNESDSYTDKSGVYVSNNAGKSWSQVNGDNRLTQRAWYYTEIFTDPNNENVVYVLSAPALRSIDGGNTFEDMPVAHGDTHDMWINPSNSNNLVLADDGGAAVSFNYGKSWSSLNNMPTGQFYRISTDNLFPYNIYGGQQDNSSVRIASLSMSSGGIGERDWTSSAGGESAFLAFDPDNPRYVLGGSYLGTIEVLDMQSKTSTNIMAAPIQYLGREARNMKYLFNWNAPIIKSQHEPNTYYHGAQMVLKTTDMGITWTEMSPDLTRDIDEKQGNGGGPYTNEAVGAENYGTIAYIMESPHEKGVIYTGSDDGYVHITKNNGASWENITPKGLQESLINAIEVSPHDPATAYIATTRYKLNDFTPALYKTTNYGKTWTNISTGIPNGAFTRVVREDTTDKNILYAGTETGIYISWNGGGNWEPLQLNMPITPILDLQVHKGDLIVATSGRGFWILDDLGLINQYKGKKNSFKLFDPEPAVYGSWGSPLSKVNPDFNGTDTFEGVNPANGMVIYYNLPKLKDSTAITMKIRNAKGELIRTFTSEKDESFKENEGGPPPAPTLSTNEGLNRFVWDMHHSIMPGIDDVYFEANFRGHNASPGRYKIGLMMDNVETIVDGEIIKNPNFDSTPGQFEEHNTFMSEMETNLADMHEKIKALKSTQNQIADIVAMLKNKNGDASLIITGEKLVKELKAWDEEMVQRRSQAYDDVENFPNKFTAEYLFLINHSDSPNPKVTKPARNRKAELDAQWIPLNATANKLMNIDIPQFNEALWKAGIGAIKLNE